MGSATFPWEKLKAESLRTVCRDVGHIGRTRDAMIGFLKTVETLGCLLAFPIYLYLSNNRIISSGRRTRPTQ